MATSAAKLLETADRGLSFEEAQARILATAPNPKPRTLPISETAGRTLASPLKANRTTPPWPVSAMDGYALRHSDLGEGPLLLDGQTAAGDGAGAPLKVGGARRIFTGALLPPGADTILIQEEADARGEALHVLGAPKQGDFVRPAGFDFAEGQTLLEAGQVLTPPALALAAAANCAQVEVAVAPKIAVLSTGDELRAPGHASAPEHVVASNGLALTALLRSTGAEALDLGFVCDDLAAIQAKIAQAKEEADLLITTGGASVGDFDLVQEALAQSGGTPQFWQVMMRPGKPVFLWTLEGLTVLGLPGNPVSAYVCARLLALPWVRKALGQSQLFEPQVTLPLAGPMPANGPRRQFARAEVVDGKLRPASSQDSSLLHTLHLAGALINRPPHDPAKTEGEQVSTLLM